MLKTDSASPQIVLCGDNCLNVILLIEGALKRGANLDVTRAVRRPGGNALVTAMALSGWGIRSSYFGVMGKDSQGIELQNWMGKVGLDTSGVATRNLATRVSYVIMDEDERTILDLRNPSPFEAELQAQDWPGIETAMGTANAILLDRYCSGIHKWVQQIVNRRREQGERPVLMYRTGSRATSDFEAEAAIFSAADIVLTKSTFLESSGFGPDAVEGCRSLSRSFQIPVVVSTCGKDGAAYFDNQRGEGHIAPALPVGKPVTILGGGDFFRAGFILTYMEGKSLHESVQMGNVAAGIHCSRTEEEKAETVFFKREELERELG